MSAVEWLEKNIRLDMNPFELIECFNQAKELEEKQRDEFSIGFAEWLINIKNFDDFHKETTTQELLEIYKQENL